MNNQNNVDDISINGFFTKIVSLMFICSVFVSSVDVVPAQARVDSDAGGERSNIILDEVYLESSIVSSSETSSVFGSTLPEAEVAVTYHDGGTYSTKADADGYYELNNLPLMNEGDAIDITASTGGVKMSEHLQLNR
ncbi:carboxypeptidase-like regulatory domain-containing protein [Salinicoccus sp. YB14-2]|uniref:carboxypeptidase-like regulatory domain-containing protein n=1 Tax=Salinicoccus sp. YB14-2 TaxID=1572701 RepID=UPI00068B70D4|nr:carboxypeptidase-like regulatory domain-containing protein [Salinicoccus sp. YB14-2]